MNTNAGMSKCPICGKEWLVTLIEDCRLPVCGCYGHDRSQDNPNRPCEQCGIDHAFKCKVKRFTIEHLEGCEKFNFRDCNCGRDDVVNELAFLRFEVARLREGRGEIPYHEPCVKCFRTYEMMEKHIAMVDLKKVTE